MSDPMTPLAPDLPPIEQHRSAQYEFSDEQNRQISGLVDAMRVCSGLMQLMGLAFVVLCVMSVVAAMQDRSGYGPAIGLAPERCFVWQSGSGRAVRPHRFAALSRPRMKTSGTS